MEGDTPQKGETKTPEAPKNGTQTSDSSEAEKLREQLREAQAKAARVGQVENELARLKEAEEERKQAELEKQNEFKTLYEQEKAKREAHEAQLAEGKQREELEKAKAEVLADYSDEVKALAEETGMVLTAADDEAKAAFKGKLDKIQQRIGATAKVTPNNPNRSSGKTELSRGELSKALKDPTEFAKLAANRPGIASMMSSKS